MVARYGYASAVFIGKNSSGRGLAGRVHAELEPMAVVDCGGGLAAAVGTSALHQQDPKIQALTLDLVHYKRIRFGRTSKQMGVIMFEETLDTDICDLEMEVEQPSIAPKRKTTPPPGTQTPAPHQSSP